MKWMVSNRVQRYKEFLIYARGEVEKGQKTEEDCMKLQERDKGDRNAIPGQLTKPGLAYMPRAQRTKEKKDQVGTKLEQNSPE